jgi:two-component system, cell cycle sensor histidine kinase and response regulator CckA
LTLFPTKSATPPGILAPNSVYRRLRHIERREWWLWASAVLVTLLLTLAVASFLVPSAARYADQYDSLAVHPAIRGLVGLVLLFDIYTVYQQFQIVRIRRQVLEQEKLFRLITENAGDMIAVVDVNGHRLYNSPSYQRVLGYSAEELQTTSSFEQIHPDDKALVREAAEEARQTGFGRRIEYRMRKKDGSWVYLESTASAIRTEGGQIEKLVIVNRDITARRRLEEQFRQAQKMEAVGRLSGGVAHDFNNLLGVIIGYSEILTERLPQSDPIRENVDEILKAGQRAASLTRQLLAFSRQQVLEPRAFDLNEVVSDTEKMLRRLVGEDIEFNTQLKKPLGTVKADPGQIEQVLMNLVVNARDAMPEGGRLSIETTNVEIDHLFVQGYSFPFKPGPYVLLTVGDTGVGMDAETQTHIFEPFFTTKDKDAGTGLGLATVYGIVKQSGGYIEVLSELGSGTTFKIYLPRIEENAQRCYPTTESFDTLHGDETILVAEDETALRTLTCSLLQSLGYSVLEAKNGADALEIATTRPAIDLLLTDVVMPGINGKTLAHHLIRQNQDLRVIYMSGYTGQGIGNKGDLSPTGLFLPKPFTREALARKIRMALDNRTPAATM